MATWKEQGVVPDSDDEDDVESQTIAPAQDGNGGERTGRLPSYDGQIQDGHSIDALPQVTSADENILGPDDINNSQDSAATNPTLPGHFREWHTAVDKATIPSSPASPRGFRVPDLFLDFKDNDLGKAREQRPGIENPDRRGHGTDDLHSSEEISKSYVRITSAESSPLSSPPESQSSPRLNSSRGEIGAPKWPSNVKSAVPLDGGLQLNKSVALKRSFRQRNLNQIYPYHVEMEKYRRDLKGRGIALTLIAESQENGRRTSPSPEEDSQTSSTQELESDGAVSGTEESQPLELATENPPSSLVQTLAEEDGDSDILTAGLPLSDDDEFPDIGDLLRQQPLENSRSRLKRRTHWYSSKAKRQRLSMTQTHSAARTFRQIASTAFDTLASPPATSSPFLGSSSRELTPHMNLSLSKVPNQVQHISNEQSARASTDLLTPVTSAVKPAPISIDSGSESADHLVNDSNDDRSVSEPSSDESVQLRRIGKRIRGVLPASHLRLDTQQKKHVALRPSFRDSASISPARAPNRRGVAVPRATRDGDGQDQLAIHSPIPFLDLSDGMSDDSEYMTGNLVDRGSPLERESILTQSRLGYADEVDSIDAMLPPRKRITSTTSYRPKKSRVGSLSRKVPGEGHKQQSTITQHLERPRLRKSDKYSVRRSALGLGEVRGKKQGRFTHSKSAPDAPRLGILDVIEASNRRELPQFIRIAVRAASSQRGQGRQALSGKYFRLSSREDTQDVQLVLQHWREGKIRPKGLPVSTLALMPAPLQRIENNGQTRLRSPVQKVRSGPHTKLASHTGMPRKLFVSKALQRSMNDFVIPEESGRRPQERPYGENLERSGRLRQQTSSRRNFNYARPAQLESSGVNLPTQYPSVSFRSSKKVLDTLYRASRKSHTAQANLILSRFLADDDIARPSTESHIVRDVKNNEDKFGIRKEPRSRQLKKRLPQRIDAGAAVYRQPSDPLILESLEFTRPSYDDIESSILQGLGKYGTNYPVNFDVFPLQSGVFFHQTTFIGSGQFAKVMAGTDTDRHDVNHINQKFTLGSKQFYWGPWDANVSSEIGLCFDWVFDQLISKSLPESNPPATGATDLIISIQKYMQQIIRFEESVSVEKFMSRMQQVLREFISRLDSCLTLPECNPRPTIEILERCTILAYQLLSLSRATPHLTSMISELEDLLQTVASTCVKWLLSQGLTIIRKLYDDLQYLSFRDSGIRSIQYVAHCWVIVIKVLNTAQIPRGLFWDVANPHLLTDDIKDTKDARRMEKLWYTLFSILPLFEFDDFGVLIPGMRNKISTTNWPLPQQVMKRVFALYRSNQKQSSGFNGYCRTLVHRCHFLVVEWGWWKCGGLIGTLFDFFASQKLAHLRNEEVYSSPHFLEELHLEPILDVESEDRCFHIFLKIVALGIKHFKRHGDIKSIRNLVARLLPNHDRQYPKEEAIHHRDLASLRNHHDLLCTLYWAAPSQQRPSVTLIQELVVPDRSHKEACLINMRAWENLARFVVTRPPFTETFTPLAVWRRAFFDQLWQQLLNTEIEVRQQAESLSIDKLDATLETEIQQLVTDNTRTTSAELAALLEKTITIVPIATSLGTAKEAFDSTLLVTVLNRGTCDEMTSAALRIVELFLDRIAAEDQSRKQLNSPTGDSQDSLDINMDHWEAFHELKLLLLPSLSTFMRGLLATSNATTPGIAINLVKCWARLVAVLAEGGQLETVEFLVHGPNAIFQNQNIPQYEQHLWITALRIIVEFYSSLDGLVVPGFDLGREWLLILTKPMDTLARSSAYSLETSLRAKGHYLLPPVRDGQDLKPYEAISYALNIMRRAVHNSDSTNSGSRRTATNEKAEFSATIKAMLESMRVELERADLGSVAHIKYVEFVQHIIAAIRAYANQIQPVSHFFLHSSPYYWPQETDPQLFSAGILSYSLQLSGKDSKKVSSQLFHFLLNGLRQSYLHGQEGKHGYHVQLGTKNWEFTEFLLVEVLPVAIHTSINGCPWILAKTYFPVVANRVVKLLRKHGAHASLAFDSMRNVLRWIIRCMQEYFNRMPADRHNIEGILGLTISFWQTVGPSMVAFSQSSEPRTTQLRQYQDIIEALVQQLSKKNLGTSAEKAITVPNNETPTKGVFFESFKEALEAEMAEWRMDEDAKWVDIKPVGARGGPKRVVLSLPTLQEVLAREYYSSSDPLLPPIPFVGQVLC